jgi:acetylornithine deacetylase/succinyl-diaminopimelate desuccinylase-like protein
LDKLSSLRFSGIVNDSTTVDGAIAPAIGSFWEERILPALSEYIRIPCLSPAFDPQWEAHGAITAAANLLASWARSELRTIEGSTIEIVQLPDRTPLLLVEIPGDADGTALLYGHLDKQPDMSGWLPHLGPRLPVVDGDRLYGRGGADDGYALFAAVLAIKEAAARGAGLPRCVILIEACEESGSYDLPFYLDHLADRIGQPDVVLCLDSGCADYHRLWLTTSLRGLVNATLHVGVLHEGVHSGDASGIVPSSFRVLRILLDRLEDSGTGQIRLAGLQTEIPPERAAEARLAADMLGTLVHTKFPFLPDAKPAADDIFELILNRTWRPQLEVIGMDGVPPLAEAGNVMRPHVAAKLSIRIPPGVSEKAVARLLAHSLEAHPPYGVPAKLQINQMDSGWNAPPIAQWLREVLDEASTESFGAPAGYIGEGGGIPFVGLFGERYPDAQFVVTGVLGPGANAHGPNEFLHIPTAKKVTSVVCRILEAIGQRALQ